MNVLDGLNYYKQSSDSDWKFTLNVENSANEVLKLIALYGDQPNSAALAAAHELLDDIEKWKAICLKERMGQRPWHHPFDHATQGDLGHLGTRNRVSDGSRWQPLRFGS